MQRHMSTAQLQYFYVVFRVELRKESGARPAVRADMREPPSGLVANVVRQPRDDGPALAILPMRRLHGGRVVAGLDLEQVAVVAHVLSIGLGHRSTVVARVRSGASATAEVAWTHRVRPQARRATAVPKRS